MHGKVCIRPAPVKNDLREHLCLFVVPIHPDISFPPFLGVRNWNVGRPFIKKDQRIIYCSL